MNYLQKNEIDVDRYKNDHKEVVRNIKAILKTLQRFTSENIVSNDDKRMQSIHSVELYVYGINNNLLSKNWLNVII